MFVLHKQGVTWLSYTNQLENSQFYFEILRERKKISTAYHPLTHYHPLQFSVKHKSIIVLLQMLRSDWLLNSLDKGGKFLKNLLICVGEGGGWKEFQDNVVLLTGLIT